MRGQALDLVDVEDGIAFRGDFRAMSASSVCSLFVNLLAKATGEPCSPILMSAVHGLCALAQDFRARRERPHGEFLPLLERGADDPPSDHRGDGYSEAFLSGKSLDSGIGLYSRSIRHTLSPPFFRAFFSFMRKWASR